LRNLKKKGITVDCIYCTRKCIKRNAINSTVKRKFIVPKEQEPEKRILK
jgi:hypothetical protein